MRVYHKLQLASEMFAEAHRQYSEAEREVDYVNSILLSGAVIGIIGPLLKEQGGQPTHNLLAKMDKLLADPGDISPSSLPQISRFRIRTFYPGCNAFLHFDLWCSFSDWFVPFCSLDVSMTRWSQVYHTGVH